MDEGTWEVDMTLIVMRDVEREYNLKLMRKYEKE
jgi:hypothetical protein